MHNIKRIPLKDGDEQDVLTGWRYAYLYTRKPGVCKRVKKKYNKRFRKIIRKSLREYSRVEESNDDVL